MSDLDFRYPLGTLKLRVSTNAKSAADYARRQELLRTREQTENYVPQQTRKMAATG